MPNLSPIISPQKRPGRVSIGSVRATTIDEIDEAWAWLQENPGNAIRVEFEDEKERRRWMKEARTYCESMDPPLRFRQERSEKYADASDTVRYFRLSVATGDDDE